MENRLEREIAYSADFFQSQVPRTKRYPVYKRLWFAKNWTTKNVISLHALPFKSEEGGIRFLVRLQTHFGMLLKPVAAKTTQSEPGLPRLQDPRLPLCVLQLRRQFGYFRIFLLLHLPHQLGALFSKQEMKFL